MTPKPAPEPPPEPTPLARRDSDTEEQITAFEISEDRRLRELGIDPDDHPICIWQKLQHLLGHTEETPEG